MSGMRSLKGWLVCVYVWYWSSRGAITVDSTLRVLSRDLVSCFPAGRAGSEIWRGRVESWRVEVFLCRCMVDEWGCAVVLGKRTSTST